MNRDIVRYRASTLLAPHLENALRQTNFAMRRNQQNRKTWPCSTQYRYAISETPVQENAIYAVGLRYSASIFGFRNSAPQSATSIDGGYAGASKRSERGRIFSGAKRGAASRGDTQ
jgi:hypothetical protein